MFVAQSLFKKPILLVVFFLISILSNSVVFGAESYFDKNQKAVICAEPLPEFTLRMNSNPSKSQVKELCACIWASFPEGGWERETSSKIRLRQKPIPMAMEFVPKFGDSLKKCGGYKL